MSVESMVRIVNQNEMIFIKNTIMNFLKKGSPINAIVQRKRLEKEREEQMAKNETPQYSGKCRHLTAEEQQQLEAEGRQPSIRFKVPQGKIYLI